MCIEFQQKQVGNIVFLEKVLFFHITLKPFGSQAEIAIFKIAPFKVNPGGFFAWILLSHETKHDIKLNRKKIMHYMTIIRSLNGMKLNVKFKWMLDQKKTM